MIHATKNQFLSLLIKDDTLPLAVQAETRHRSWHREEAIYSIQGHVHHQALREVHQEEHHQAEIPHHQGSQEEVGSSLVDRLVVGKVSCRVKGACLLVMKGEDQHHHHRRERRRGWGRGVGRGVCRGLVVLLLSNGR